MHTSMSSIWVCQGECLLVVAGWSDIWYIPRPPRILPFLSLSLSPTLKIAECLEKFPFRPWVGIFDCVLFDIAHHDFFQVCQH